MNGNNDKLRIFLRRKGQYIGLCVMIGALVGLMVLGANKSVVIGEDYISTPKVQEKVQEKLDSMGYSEDEIWDTYYKLDELGLGYEAHIEDLDGEMFLYNVDFDRTVDDSTIKELDEQIVKKCGKPSDDNWYGEYNIVKTGEKTMLISLDLGSTRDDKAVTGIFRALNDVPGVKKAVVNSASVYSKELSKKVKAPDADAGTQQESERAWAEYRESLKKHFDGLGLYFPVGCDQLATAFTLDIVYEEDIPEDTEKQIKEKLGKPLDEQKRTWNLTRPATEDNKELYLIVTADSFEYIKPEEAALCDTLLKELNSEFKGIKEVNIY